MALVACSVAPLPSGCDAETNAINMVNCAFAEETKTAATATQAAITPTPTFTPVVPTTTPTATFVLPDHIIETAPVTCALVRKTDKLLSDVLLRAYSGLYPPDTLFGKTMWVAVKHHNRGDPMVYSMNDVRHKNPSIEIGDSIFISINHAKISSENSGCKPE